MPQITIAGQTFEAPDKYAEGHELNQNEADALNQTYHENLRNNFAKKVKDGMEAGVGLEVLQQQFAEYAAAYEFGVRTGGGGGPRDPVMTEAMNMARAIIRNALKTKGKKVSDYAASAINEKAKELVASKPEIMEAAKKRVAETQAAASDDLGDMLSGLTEKPAEQPAAVDPNQQ